MKSNSHPRSRARRRELDRQYRQPRDVFGSYIDNKDPYEPNNLSTPYCPNCHKEKLQFESEREADLYMAYNAERIARLKGKAPIRAYYCNDCRCWHVTSTEKRQRYWQKENGVA